MPRPSPHDAAQLGVDFEAGDSVDVPPVVPGPSTERPAPRASGATRPRTHRPAPSARTEADRARTAAQDRTLRRLEPVALIAGTMRPMFRLDHVRTLAESTDVLTGEEGRPDPGSGRLTAPRALSYLGRLLPGLAALGLVEPVLVDGAPLFQRSDRAGSNGNLQTVWRLTESGRTTARLTAMSEIATVIAQVRSRCP